MAIRHRTRRLPDFETGFGENIRSRRCWFDRLKFSIARIRLTCDATSHDDVKSHLEQRAAEPGRHFSVDQLPSMALKVVFPRSHYLFNFQLNLRRSGNIWAGQAALEINPTRAFRYGGPNWQFQRVPPITPVDLMPSSLVRMMPTETLDGNDNYLPDPLLNNALHADWAAFVELYLDSVTDVISDAFGPLGALLVREGSAPLIVFPRRAQWTFKEVEAYWEFRDEDALLRTHEIALRSQAIASRMSVDNHGEAPTPGRVRSANALATTVRLGASGVTLSAYAKTHDRIRMEVRYRKRVTRAWGFSQGEGERPNFIREALEAGGLNAVERLVLFAQGYRMAAATAEPGLNRFSVLLGHVAMACQGDAPLMSRVLSLLIVHGGISPSTDTRLEAAALAMVDRGVLDIVRATGRTAVERRLAGRFVSSVNRLRALSA